MSRETLDFTDFFKSSLSIDNINDCHNIVEVGSNNNNVCANFSSKEEDVKGWVKNRLSDLQISIDDGEMNSAVMDCVYMLLKERQHLQEQSKAISIDFSSIMSQLEMGHREKESLSNQLLVMKQDINTANGKMSALKNEHRELRNQWLAEKSELESRCFQLQALQTQYQGTMRKKEKEFEKLQSQLIKTIKDGQRSQKAVITVSKPLQRMSTQAKPLTLRDAELLASKDNILALENENKNLRLAINDLTANLGSFQAKMTSILAYQMPSAPAVPQITFEVPAVDATPFPSSNEKSDIKKCTDITSPEHLFSKTDFPAIKNSTTALTPARQIMRQADSAVKKLRHEANMMFAAATTTTTTDNEGGEHSRCNQPPLFLRDSEAVVVTGRGDEEIEQLRKQLEEALAVIQEQDWLIHAALVGKLPCKTLPENSTVENCWSDGEEDSNYTRLRSSRRSTGSVRRVSTGSRYSSGGSSPGSPFMIDFLPPASPETRRILEEAGWPLPATSGLYSSTTSTAPFGSDRSMKQVNEKLLLNEDVLPVTFTNKNDLRLALGLE